MVEESPVVVRPTWMSTVNVENMYSVNELNTLQYEYILQLENAARHNSTLQTIAEGHRERVEKLEADLREARLRHQQDITRIGDRLMEEAENREWCDIYDDVINDINAHMWIELPTREQEYTVAFDVSAVVHVQVTATSPSNAEEVAKSKLDLHSISFYDSDVELYDATIEDYRVHD